MKKILLVLLLFTGLALSSCGKDKTNPTVTITSPSNNAQYKVGDTFLFTGSVTDNDELSKISFTGVTGLPDITTFNSPIAHAFSYSLEVPDGTPTGSVINLTVTATDLAGNTGSSSVSVEVVE